MTRKAGGQTMWAESVEVDQVQCAWFGTDESYGEGMMIHSPHAIGAYGIEGRVQLFVR